MKCKHKKPPDLTYLKAYNDAEERMKRGEHQIKCDHCCKWIWEAYFSQSSKG